MQPRQQCHIQQYGGFRSAGRTLSPFVKPYQPGNTGLQCFTKDITLSFRLQGTSALKHHVPSIVRPVLWHCISISCSRSLHWQEVLSGQSYDTVSVFHAAVHSTHSSCCQASLMTLYQYFMQLFTTLTVGVVRPVYDTVAVFEAAIHYTHSGCCQASLRHCSSISCSCSLHWQEVHNGSLSAASTSICVQPIPPRLSCLGNPYSTKTVMPGESIFHQGYHAWGVHIPPRLSCLGSPYSTKTVMPGESIFHQDCHAWGVHIPPRLSCLRSPYSTDPIISVGSIFYPSHHAWGSSYFTLLYH